MILQNDSVLKLKGVGDKIAEHLAQAGIKTVQDLLGFLPIQYRDLSGQSRIVNLNSGEIAVIRGTVLKSKSQLRRGKMSMFSFAFGDETATIDITYFNQPYLEKKFQAGMEFTLTGRVSEFNGRMQMTNPHVYPVNVREIVPLYLKLPGIGVATHKKIVEQALLVKFEEEYSEKFLQECGIASLNNAFLMVHKPKKIRDTVEGQKSIVYRKIMEFICMLEIMSRPKGATPIHADASLYNEYLKKLPFVPTNSQESVMHEIESDVASTKPMNRLLQGDVGSGKTLPCVYALYLASRAGCLSLMMAPTEILAEQHYAFVQSIFGESCALLTGSTKVSRRREIKELVDAGKVRVIVGTHALLFSDIDFNDLALVITDEQHRFGVAQRAALMQGNRGVHTLIMSATPIPRTLSLILYDKTSVSVISKPPAGRKPIKTRIVGENKRGDMYNFIADRIRLGEQVYVVCPLIDENPEFDARSVEEVYEEISPIINGACVLHGRMSSKEKHAIMSGFKAGKIPLIVSTTVIEVGVDVPNACIMVIESAQRFGLAQLHQLRGRVGRGDKESYCFLVTPNINNERLGILRRSTDGFYIAEKDLELRGAGEFLGRAQSGKGANLDLVQNIELLKHARDVLDKSECYDDIDKIKRRAANIISESELVLN